MPTKITHPRIRVCRGFRTAAGSAAIVLACGNSDRAADQSKAVPGAIIEQPADGSELSGPTVTIALRTENIALAPAGDTTPGTGHLHLFVNTEVTAPGELIPTGAGIVHLGKAQQSHELTGLAAGDYTVIAVLGDLAHRRIEPQIMDTVRFRVRSQ